MARSIEYEEITAFSVTAYVDGLDEEYSKDDRHIRGSIYYEDGELVDIKPFGDLSGKISKTPTVTFDDLVPNTRYEIYYYIYPDGYAGEASGRDYFSTKKIRPRISNIKTDYGKEDVRVYGYCDEHESGIDYEIYTRETGSSEWYLKETLSKPPRTYTSIAVNKYNVDYDIKIVAIYDGIEQGQDSDKFLVPPLSPGQGIGANNELNSLQYKGEMNIITSIRGNNFISGLNDVIGYRAATDGVDYSQIANSNKLKDDKILYATAGNAIDYYSRIVAGYSHNDVRSGDPVYGSYIIDLTNIMNNLI